MQDVAEVKKGITGSTLKWIALVSMLIDHSAYVFIIPILVENGIYSVADYSATYIAELMEQGSIGWYYLAYQIMRRLIGRLAFPIYCYCLVEGFGRTGSRAKYAGRLALLAVLSEVPFDLAFYHTVFETEHQNVFLTLLLGFLMIWGMEKLAEKVNHIWLIGLGQLLLFLAVALLAEWISCDYGWKGIFALMLLYQFRYQKGAQILAGCIAFIWEPAALLAFLPISLYNGRKGQQNKLFFYGFYPVHLLVLYVITTIVK
ncbi:MAG: conjugal transfer protein TraX [Lachnospiraceae bacterium]|nr:conjugal transfer protein TraX [Lachnospiraceae bacterium]